MKRALLIGASGLERLGVEADIELMHQLLLDHGFARDDIMCCRTPPVRRADILAALDLLIDVAKHDDVIVIYFSGHGGVARFNGAIGGRDLSRHWRYLVTEDPEHSASAGVFQGILDVELGFLIDHRLAFKCPNVTVILECCYAGEMLEPVRVARTRDLERIPLFDVPEFLVDSQPWGALDIVRLSGPLPVVVAATTGSRQSYELTTGKRNGCFTWWLDVVLRRYLGHPRSCYWGPIIDEVCRAVQLENQRLYQQPTVTPRGRQVFGTHERDLSSSYEIVVGSDGRLVMLGGRFHGLRDGDIVELVDSLLGSTGLHFATLRDVQAARARLEIQVEPPTLDGRRSWLGCLRTRRQALAVRLRGDTPTIEQLRAALADSPWLREADALESVTHEISIVDNKLWIFDGLAEVDPRPLGLRELRNGDGNTAIAGAIDDLEARARARSFVEACRYTPALPESISFRMLTEDGHELVSGSTIHAEQNIMFEIKQAAVRAETKYVNLVLLAPDGRLYLDDVFDLMNEDPDRARGMQWQSCLEWPERLAQERGPATLFVLVTSERVELAALAAAQPSSSKDDGARADVLDKLFLPVESSCLCIDFTFAPD